MKTTKWITIGIAILFIGILISAFKLPNHWFEAGSEPKNYNMGIDTTQSKINKTNVITVQSKVNSINNKKSKRNKVKGWGTLMQNFLPDKYRGKKIKMTAFIKSDSVNEWCAIWMRVDSKFGNGVTAFDNLKAGESDRSITGTNVNWIKRDIILYVDSAATNIAYGALLQGNGKMWVKDLKIELTDLKDTVTGMEKDLSPQIEPNTDFK